MHGGVVAMEYLPVAISTLTVELIDDRRTSRSERAVGWLSQISLHLCLQCHRIDNIVL